MEPTTKKSNGALIGSIIVIVLLILGGVYFWMSKSDMPIPVNQENEEQSLGESQGAAAIEADLYTIDMENSVADPDSSADVNVVQ